MNHVYLDHAAATPVDKAVIAAMLPYLEEQFYNPSAVYDAGRQVRAAVDAARATVAHYFGSRPAEVIFTAGATEANNLAIRGVMDSVLRRFPDAELLVSAVEHDAVLAPAERYTHRIIPVTAGGVVEPAAIENQIDDQTALVSIMYVNNEIGTIQPIQDIGRLLESVRKDRKARGITMPLYFHSDAAQAANYLDLQAARLGVDLLTINGGKIYGPKQTGALYVRAGVDVTAQISGGGQEQGKRSGTENVAGIIGIAAALDIAQQTRHAESKRLTELQQYFFKQLAVKIPGAVVNGSQAKRLPNNLHITLPGSDNERLLFQLDAAGIMAAAGSACNASSDTPSHVLRAIGLSDDAARASLRLTMGRATTQADLDYVIVTLTQLAK